MATRPAHASLWVVAFFKIWTICYAVLQCVGCPVHFDSLCNASSEPVLFEGKLYPVEQIKINKKINRLLL